MKYTKHFSFIVKENGQPRMNADSFRTMMNLVFLEGVISGLKQSNKGTDAFYKYDVSIFREEKRLTEITGNLNPDDFMNKILSATD